MATKHMQVGPDGKVQIYDTHSKKWSRVFAVDAREQLANGTASLGGPTVEMESDAGRVKVCAEEVDTKLALGWQIVSSDDESEADIEGLRKTAQPDKTPDKISTPVYDFNSHNIDELRKFAQTAGIVDYEKMTKPKLVAALDDVKFDPTAQK